MSTTDDLQHLRTAVLAIAQQLPLDSARHDNLYRIAFEAASALGIEARNRGELRDALLRWVQPTPLEQAGDWLYPNGARPTCSQCGQQPMYLAGLCSSCWAASSWAQEHRDTRGDHYGLNGPGSSASTKCPLCGGRGEDQRTAQLDERAEQVLGGALEDHRRGGL